MTSNNPEEIRRDIERTRAELSGNVNALADGANPANVARRQIDKVKEGASGIRASIFGDPDDPWDQGSVGHAQDRAAVAVDDARAVVADAPRQLRRRAQGNPLAAGLVAFGVGALVAGLIPSSRAEQDLARAAKDQAEPLVEEARAMAHEAAENLKPAAQSAAEEVKGVAATAGENIKGEAQGAVDDVKGQARSSAEQVRQDDRNPLGPTTTSRPRGPAGPRGPLWSPSDTSPNKHEATQPVALSLDSMSGSGAG